MSVPRGAPLRAQLCPYLCPPALSPAGAGRASAPLPWRCRGCRGGSGRSGGPRQPPLIAACRRLSPPSRAPLPGSRGSGALLCRWMPRAPSRSLLPFSLPPSLPPSFPPSFHFHAHRKPNPAEILATASLFCTVNVAGFSYKMSGVEILPHMVEKY